MKLLTQSILNALPKLYQTEDIPLPEKLVICKFFTPWTCWTWYVFEGEKQDDGDFLLFGMVNGFEQEFGYFCLSELEAIKGPFGLRIERDLAVFKESYKNFL